MGDQAGTPVIEDISYISSKEIQKIISRDINIVDRANIFSCICRINTLYMIANAGSGHIGSSFSSLDIVSCLLLEEVFQEDENNSRSVYFSSKGHDVPGFYAALIALGKLKQSNIHELRKLNGLPGHPDISIPYLITNTGSLGMGISKAKGMVIANRLAGIKQNIYVLTGDGELQEGQFWESLGSAANSAYSEITVIIDHNKIQSDTLVSDVSDLGDLDGKLDKFGWHVDRCDGNNTEQIFNTINNAKKIIDKPKVIIADTIKGCGVSFMEVLPSRDGLYQYHSGAPSNDDYRLAFDELRKSLTALVDSCGLTKPIFTTVNRTAKIAPLTEVQSLLKSYSDSLVKESEINQNIVVLDADLVLDTGLVAFKKKFPERFIECGIAEQDMVSQAGGIALKGYLPIVHSFSCFLTSRPNEQIYNNSTEKTHIIYVGSLAGVIPGGPGHSHQSVRDISLMASIPGLKIIEPSCEQEVTNALSYAVNKAKESIYLRLISIGIGIPYDNKHCKELKEGVGSHIIRGSNIAIISYGPLLLSEAYNAAQEYSKENDQISVINMPWLNYIDNDWLIGVVGKYSAILILDNHFKEGSFGNLFLSEVAKLNDVNTPVIKPVAILEIPCCGSNEEVLDYHELDKTHILKYLEELGGVIK